MSGPATDPLLRAWAGTLLRHRERPAIFDTAGASLYSFGAIENKADAFVEELQDLSAGEVVAIQIGNHAAWPALFLACLQRELVTLPLERSMAAAEVETAIEICRASLLVRLSAEGELEFHRRERLAIDWDTRRPSLLKLTSGTTAAPRAVRFRSAQLLADAEQICDTMGISETDRNYAVIPVSHSYGFSNLLTPLLTRGVAMVLSNDRMPRAVLDDLARTKATVFAGMPVFYQAFCEMENVPALPALRLGISAGAPLPAEVARRFGEKFGQPIHSFYGSSECGGICYDREGRGEIAGFVGAAMNGVSLEVLEPEASATQIRVRSNAVADGYFPNPDETKLGGGSFAPDDLLCATENGWTIVGRTSDLINVAGKKVNPAEVEAELLRCTGVREAIVFGRESTRRNEEVAACVVAENGITEEALRASCGRRLSGWQVPKRIFLVERIPINERGKTSRRHLARLFPKNASA